MALVLLQLVGQQRLVAQSGIVDEWDAGQPVAVLQFAVALHVVLSSGKVPQEVAPVHPVALIGKEEAQILPLCGNLHGAAAPVVRRALVALDASQPALIRLHVARVAAVHAGEEHILCIDGLVLGADHEVAVGLVGTGFLAALVHRGALVHLHAAIVVNLILRVVALAPCQRAIAILVTAQIVAQGEDVFGRVLVHRRVGRRADADDGIRRVANHQHQHAQQRGVLQAGRDERPLL